VHRSRFILFLLLVSTPVQGIARSGQQPQPRLLSIEEALAVALARSEEMVIAQAGVDRAGGEQIRARSDLFPQLSAAASYDRALASEFEGLFDVSDELGDLDELPFGQKNTWRLNFSFSQSLYTGGRIAAQSDVANASRQNAEINLASTRAQVMLDLVRAYYDVALTDRLVEIAEATYRQADATYEQVRVAYQAGSQPEFELLRAQVTRDNERPIIIRRRAERDIAMLRLRQLLEIPPAERIAVSVPLDADTLAPPAPFAAAVLLTTEDAPDVNRATIRQAQTAVQQSEALVRAARAQRLPTVTFNSGYGEIAYPSGAIPDDFRRNWTIGAIAQVPILTGGRLRADVAIARAEARMADARLRQARELAALDTQSTLEELRATVSAWEASAGIIQQAQRAYQIAELRYREGVSTQVELNDARLALVLAQATRAQAARDVQVARARVALLPDLPVSNPSGIIATPRPAPEVPQPQPFRFLR
jgi:outer membrane protein